MTAAKDAEYWRRHQESCLNSPVRSLFVSVMLGGAILADKVLMWGVVFFAAGYFLARFYEWALIGFKVVGR